MNKVSADMYALGLVIELAKANESGIASVFSNASVDYAKNLSGFISTLSSNLQADIHDGVDVQMLIKLIRNGSGQ